ncbi:MAG: MBOAT family O-acyltransferase, partial [bacterium]
VLVFFKYTNFFTQDVLGLDVQRLHLILPAGISFHTFQSLSYTIDVYRKELRATRSVVTFATFVLFFPQLVAGPIVRAQTLLPQLEEPPPLELTAAANGLFRIVVGLFKKVALADTLALTLVDRVFETPGQFSTLEVVAGVYGYALQIYLDFSAYSDIAIGSAQVLGFTLPENFRTPYRSANLQEFWRRWHISLSTWLRDYLYVALGGSRGAPWRTYVNLIATMLLGGLWHGASWTFVVWGALHGFGLAVTRYFQRATEQRAQRAAGLLATCAAIAVIGIAFQRAALDGAGVWTQLVVMWLYLTPLWAVLTAWLSVAPLAPTPEPGPREPEAAVEGLPWRALFRSSSARGGPAPAPAQPCAPELLRLAMCVSGAGFLVALAWAPSWTWIPLILVTWGLGLAADVVERGARSWLATGVRRAIAVVLVFQYVCLAWVFFRASSFDGALAVLQQVARLETDHANLVPVVTLALTAGFACHLWADGSFRWLRLRFVALPPWAQGAALATVALVLRELGHTKIVPFIYFQF